MHTLHTSAFRMGAAWRAARPTLLFILATLTVPWACAQGITSVDVFANSAMHVQSAKTDQYQLKVYRVDGLAQIQSQLNQGLPQTSVEARAYMQRHMPSIKKRYQAQVLNAANGMTLAIHYKLDRIPAIVINQQAVIYGITDVAKAVQIYKEGSP